MSSLKQKTVNGIIWSVVDTFAGQGIAFVVGIILARMLTPHEFGLIGMIIVFIAVSQSFVNSGFSSALIRKNDCTQVDYSTVFFFNLVSGITFFTVLFISAPAISGYFKEPELVSIIQVLGLVLIVDSLSMIQRTILIKRIEFKLQARISVIASLGSGGIAIAMAYKGFGVWSLIAQQLSRQFLNTVLLWCWNCWKPSLVFSRQSFNELFGFGSKLLISGLIDTIYQNVYYLVVGKYYSAQDLGFYTRADQFKNLPSQGLNGIIGRVTYPVLASIQCDIPRLRSNYQKLVRITMFVTFILMLGMAAVSESMIITLIGEKWRSSIIYLQMLCFVGMFYPLHALNLNMLQVQGRSDLFLKLEVIKKLLTVPVIIIGIIWGIKVMIAGMMVNTLIAFYLNSHWSGQMIGYSFQNQMKDLFPSFLLAVAVNGLVFYLGVMLPFDFFMVLCIQVSVGALLTIGISEVIRFRDYLYLKKLITERFVYNQ